MTNPGTTTDSTPVTSGSAAPSSTGGAPADAGGGTAHDDVSMAADRAATAEPASAAGSGTSTTAAADAAGAGSSTSTTTTTTTSPAAAADGSTSGAGASTTPGDAMSASGTATSTAATGASAAGGAGTATTPASTRGVAIPSVSTSTTSSGGSSGNGGASGSGGSGGSGGSSASGSDGGGSTTAGAGRLPASAFGPPPSVVPTNAQFDNLLSTATDEPTFGSTAPVNLPEAVQFRRMYTVANYVLAQVPDAITALNSRLTSNSTNGAAPTFLSKSKLVADYGARIDTVLRMVNEEYLSRNDFMREVRAWFDLGTQSAPVVNVTFKTAFRNLATICADDLFGIDPDSLKKSIDPESSERLMRLYRDAKRRIVDLIESMSDSGTLGSDRLIGKWAEIVDRSLQVLQPVSQFVATDDSDKHHIWSVVGDLVGVPRASLIPYVVHARQGGDLLSDAIEIYKVLLATPAAMNEEDQDVLVTIFSQPDAVFTMPASSAAGAAAGGGAGGGSTKPAADPRTVAARRLRRNATFVLQSWPWG